MEAGAIGDSSNGIPFLGGGIGIGFPFFVGQCDGFSAMEEVVICKAVNETVVIGVFEFWGNC